MSRSLRRNATAHMVCRLFENTEPRSAWASRLGVLTIGCPAQPMASLRCSLDTRINRFFVVDSGSVGY